MTSKRMSRVKNRTLRCQMKMCCECHPVQVICEPSKHKHLLCAQFVQTSASNKLSQSEALLEKHVCTNRAPHITPPRLSQAFLCWSLCLSLHFCACALACPVSVLVCVCPRVSCLCGCVVDLVRVTVCLLLNASTQSGEQPLMDESTSFAARLKTNAYCMTFEPLVQEQRMIAELPSFSNSFSLHSKPASAPPQNKTAALKGGLRAACCHKMASSASSPTCGMASLAARLLFFVRWLTS